MHWMEKHWNDIYDKEDVTIEIFNDTNDFNWSVSRNKYSKDDWTILDSHNNIMFEIKRKSDTTDYYLKCKTDNHTDWKYIYNKQHTHYPNAFDDIFDELVLFIEQFRSFYPKAL